MMMMMKMMKAVTKAVLLLSLAFLLGQPGTAVQAFQAASTKTVSASLTSKQRPLSLPSLMSDRGDVRQHHSSSRLQGVNDDSNGAATSTRKSSTTTNIASSSSSRRQWLATAAASSVVGLVLSLQLPQPAAATYSAYTHREEDWKARLADNSNGGIKVSSARSLRSQLAEIAPMNNESTSRIFCPNGPSAAVSPLMENRCSDVRMAAPSVYGRSSDVVGNSIPGFSSASGGGGGGGYNWGAGGGSSLAPADTGGFSDYGAAFGRKN